MGSRGLICGIDPASRTGHTGVALLEEAGEQCTFKLVDYATTRDVYEGIARLGSCHVIGVDAPISIPYRGFRAVERLLVKHAKARLLPGGLPGMKLLSMIGCMIRWLAYEAGMLVVETHPATTARLNNIRIELPNSSKHAVDAVLAALAAASFHCISGLHVAAVDGYIVIPYVRDIIWRDGLIFIIDKKLDIVVG